MTTATPRQIDTVEDLIEFINLTGVHTYEVSGRRAEPNGDADTAPEPIALEIREQHDDSRIVARFRATMKAGGCHLVADIGAKYEFSEQLSLSQPAIERFLERVAVMAAWPFIRETLASTAARMEIPVPLLGLIKQGDLHIGPSVEADDVAS